MTTATRQMFAKNSKKTFADIIKVNAKKTPGVGKYDAHLSIDRVSRPMNKR